MGLEDRARAALEPYLTTAVDLGNGEFDMRCPLHEDNKRSARVNFKKKVWNCFAGCGSGSLVGLLRQMKQAGVRAEPRRKRSIRGNQTAGSEASLGKKVEAWHQALLANEERQIMLRDDRGVDEASIIRFKLGWDQANRAFAIPIFDGHGKVHNVKMYKTATDHGKKTMWWFIRGPEMLLFPMSVLKDSKWILLTEGEMDAIVANRHNIPAVTGTGGSSTWQHHWSPEFKDKRVFIAYDRDNPGERGARSAAESLAPFAKSIKIVELPPKKKGYDISDFFLDGGSTEDLKEIIRKAKPWDKRLIDPSQDKPKKVSVLDSFDSQNVGRAITFDVLVAGRSRDPYTVPKDVQSTCSMDAGPQCKFCPMFRENGVLAHGIPAWSPTILKMVEAPDSGRDEAMRTMIGALKCTKLKHEVLSYQTVEHLYVRPSWDEESSDFTPRDVYSIGRHTTQPSQLVHVVGTTWPDPRKQHNQFLAWDVSDASDAIDEFRMTPDINAQLKQFRPDPGQPPFQKIAHVATDLQEHVTQIFGRKDLHAFILLIYCSLQEFPFLGRIESRGWLDGLIVGDTRTGKSEAVRRLAAHFGMGKVINCEAASFAGIMGGLQQMGTTKEWTITWGAIPMNDRRLVVLDEASGLSHEEIQRMSDARSSGYIMLQKIAQEQAWARTRLIWLSNPRDESMEAYTYGVQAIAPLIGNREDIARFDMAMALSQKDVSIQDIHKERSTAAAEYTSEAFHNLILWAWSRQAKDVVWEEGAEDEVLHVATDLHRLYVSNPPLLQKENSRIKVARIAVALAAANFSSDPSGKKILVTPLHAVGAGKFLNRIYDQESFGYRRMSAQLIDHRAIAEEKKDTARRWLLENPDVTALLRRVEGGHFRRQMLEQIANLDISEANTAIYQMFRLGLLAPNGASVRMEPILHELVREMDAKEARARKEGKRESA